MTITLNVTDTRGSDWHISASCRDYPDPDIFYIPSFYKEAKAICAECPVRRQCLAEGLKQDCIFHRGGIFGVWGGFTPEERLPLFRKGVVSEDK